MNKLKNTAKQFIREFKDFALKGNAFNLAVGVLIGAAFQGIVNSLVGDMLSPIIGLVTKADLARLSIKFFDAEIKYGAFITAVINFFVMALVIFFIVKIIGKIPLSKSKDEPPKPVTKTCPYCKSEIHTEATRCPSCTSYLAGAEATAADGGAEGGAV